MILRRVVVLDAADLDAESRFWAGLLGGTVHADEAWHSVVVDGEWVLGVQHAPSHVPRQWPDGLPQQQVPLDLHVDDVVAEARRALGLGARERQGVRAPADNPDGTERFTVLSSPAGHPFCLGSH